ncbi:formyltransferase family protein [Desulfovibrio sp. JC010]|uniref:formyltransferase family protein n=1 Tax=Desulfovibrio sp. JC010 TaxID=2593641 RepID=UPI0013D6A1D8|nr:formyltransferase family protein [Desulfovibrio sp. JC010]NDV27169.1 hypothetical protein [Desulfovibrio sp. JC010]
MLRIICFVDHEIGYRILKSLLQTQSDIKIVAVVTTTDNATMWWPSVEKLCTHFSTPCFIYPDSKKTIINFGNIDYIFLLSWKHIIPKEIFNMPAKATINLHYSLLPKLKGVYPVNWAIIKGETYTGITFHVVDETIDGGPLLLQKKILIHSSDTARTLQLRLDDLAVKGFAELLEKAKKGSLCPIPQKEQQNQSYYTKKDYEKSNELDLNEITSVSKIINLIRGKTFLPENKSLYFRCPQTGSKCYIRLELDCSSDEK